MTSYSVPLQDQSPNIILQIEKKKNKTKQIYQGKANSSKNLAEEQIINKEEANRIRERKVQYEQYQTNAVHDFYCKRSQKKN